MEDFAIYLYTILAVLVGALIFLLKKSGADQNEEPEAGANERARIRPAGPAQAGPGGRRRNFNRRNRAQENDEAAFDDSDAEGIPEQKPSGEKIGTKKARKLEEKEARAAQRKFEEEERKKNKEIQEERRAEHLKKLEEEDRLEQEQEDEEKRLEEERIKREQEEYEAMKCEFEIEDEGEDAKTEEQEAEEKRIFVTYIKEKKVTYVEQIAAEFGIRNSETVKKLNSLLESGDLTGVLDDRGKFIYITLDELRSVASWITKKGRVSVPDVQRESNKLIKLA